MRAVVDKTSRIFPILALVSLAFVPSTPAIPEWSLSTAVFEVATREVYQCEAPGLSAARQLLCARLAPSATLSSGSSSPLDRGQNPVGWKETEYFGGGTAAQSCGYYRAQSGTVYCHLEYGRPSHVFAMSIYSCACPEDGSHSTSGSVHNYLDYPADTGFWVDFDADERICTEYFSNNDVDSAGAGGYVSQDESACRTPLPSGLWGIGVYYEGVPWDQGPMKKLEYVYG